jgi:hypothetical protein
MTERQRLPDRRASTTFQVEAFGLLFTVTASHFAHGGLGEVFIQNHKADSGAGIMASDSAIADRWHCNSGARPKSCARR